MRKVRLKKSSLKLSFFYVCNMKVPLSDFVSIPIFKTKKVFFVLVSTVIMLLCYFVFISSSGLNVLAQTDDIEEQERILRQELAAIEEEIREQEAFLREQKGETQSLERDISILNSQIERSRLDLRAKNIQIQRLSENITERSGTIEELNQKIAEEKENLARILRQSYETGSYTLIEMLLANDSLSDFFVDLDALHVVNDSLKLSVEMIQQAREKAEEEKELLSNQRIKETDVRAEIEEQKRSVEVRESERRTLLNISKGEEKTYEQLIREKETEAARIRSALFALRDAADISFGDALLLANMVSQSTGVRPAFLLAIIQQESAMGKNVGRCNRPGDVQTWRDIMPGPHDGSWRDDQAVYLRLMSELGLTPEGQPLSCPFGSGWGGAMGPAQFIPTTWESYKHRIAAATGSYPPNPWNPRDAFTASGLYLADLGAGNGGYTAEREASCRYYSGRPCGAANNTFYGDQVMQKAQAFQAQINFLRDF